MFFSLFAVAFAEEPPPPTADLTSYVHCDRVSTLLALPTLVDAIQGITSQRIQFDAPEVDTSRSVVFSAGHTATVWLPMKSGAKLPSGSNRGAGAWQERNGWAVLTNTIPPVLADVPPIGDLSLPRSGGCTIATGVAPDDPMRSNGDRLLMYINPAQPDHLSLRHLGATLPPELTRHHPAKPGAPAAAKGTFATASYARLNLSPTTEVASLIEQEIPSLPVKPLLEALSRQQRPPLPGTEIAQGPDAKPSFVVLPFARAWKPKQLAALAAELAAGGLQPKVEGDVLVVSDTLFVASHGRYLSASEDRHAVEDFAAGRGGSLLGPTLQAAVETPGMVLFRNGAYSGGPTTWVSIDPDARTMDMGLQQPNLFPLLAQTAIPSLAGLAERVLATSAPRADQSYSRAAPLELRAGEPTAGARSGRFAMVEYLDFACPHCAATSKQIPSFLEANPDVTLVTRAYPLTGACNDGLSDNGEERCFAAIAAQCANQQGQFPQMVDVLFGLPASSFTTEKLAEVAQQLGLDAPKFAACSAAPETRQQIAADAKAGTNAGVDGTPTFFVRGAVADPTVWVRVDGHLDEADLILKAARDGVTLPVP